MGSLLLRIAVLGLLLFVSSASAGPCIPGNWQQYQALANCAIGLFTLSGFNYTDTKSVLADTAISVTPFGLGLHFDLNGYSVSGVGASKSITLSWNISSSGQQEIFSERLDMAGTFTGSGIDQVVDGLPISTYLDSGTVRLNDTKNFSPTVFLVSVTDDVKLDTGLANAGTATITGYTVSFVAPEPVTWMLIPCGLLALMLRRRSRFLPQPAGTRAAHGLN